MQQMILGKITNADFGRINDYPFLFGLHLMFSSSDGGVVGDGGKYSLNISPRCRWSTEERQEAIAKMIDHLYGVLEDAKVNSVSELVGKPVMITLQNDVFVDFRILTEVL